MRGCEARVRHRGDGKEKEDDVADLPNSPQSTVQGRSVHDLPDMREAVRGNGLVRNSQPILGEHTPRPLLLVIRANPEFYRPCEPALAIAGSVAEAFL